MPWKRSIHRRRIIASCWQSRKRRESMGRNIRRPRGVSRREGLLEIFHDEHRQLRPGTTAPELKIEFFAFANVNNTIRLREGRLLVRLSDLLEGAPDTVVRAIAHILLAKMYRKPIDRGHGARYRRYVASHDIVRKTHLVRQMRGRKRLRPARGHFYDLDT